MRIFEELDLDAVIVSGSTNRRYLSGWSAQDHAPERQSGVMLVTPTEKLLYASATNLPWAAAEALDDVVTVELQGPWTQALAEEARKRKFRRIGFEDAVTPAAQYWELVEHLGSDIEIVPIHGAIDDERRVKSDREIGLISQALGITDIAFGRAADHLRAGMTERELSTYIEQQFRDLGSEGTAFDIIVASGPNAARPHHTPGDRPIQEGEPVIIDMGARVQGYCGDLTRTIWVGQPSAQLGNMYHLVAEAQRAAIASVRNGVSARAVDQAARDVFARENMEQHFVHGIGHAIGLRIHENPFLGQQSQDTLQTGNVITIEPGLYIPDWGGVRIEDVVVVEDDSCRNLTHAPKLLGVSD